MQHLETNADFKNLCRTLTPDEYSQLEANILAEGCRDPICKWRDVIVDGHNRYEICHKHSIEFATKEMEFSDGDEAEAWIINNQLGRRNSTEADRRYLLGKRYRLEKKKVGRPEEEKRAHCAPLKTAERIAGEEGINQATVKRAADYSQDLDLMSPAISQEIRSGAMLTAVENCGAGRPKIAALG